MQVGHINVTSADDGMLTSSSPRLSTQHVIDATVIVAFRVGAFQTVPLEARLK